MKKRVSVTLSAFLLAVLTGKTQRAKVGDRESNDAISQQAQDAHMDADLQRCEFYRQSLPTTEIAFPAEALRNRSIAKWVRDQHVTVDVRGGEELAMAIAAGVQPKRLTVYPDALSEAELRAAVDLGVGRVIAGSVQQIELLRSAVAKRAQDVYIRMTELSTPMLVSPGVCESGPSGFRFDSNESDTAIAAVLDHEWLNLVGLHCDVGAQHCDFVSYPAAIGHMIAEMTHVRRTHGVVLTRLGLRGGRAVPAGDTSVGLPELLRQIDDSLDDACATLHYPRPLVVLSGVPAIVEHDAA
jgi:diaminopimelate decarboxylase